jgi:hypothetical protein
MQLFFSIMFTILFALKIDYLSIMFTILIATKVAYAAIFSRMFTLLIASGFVFRHL